MYVRREDPTLERRRGSSSIRTRRRPSATEIYRECLKTSSSSSGGPCFRRALIHILFPSLSPSSSAGSKDEVEREVVIIGLLRESRFELGAARSLTKFPLNYSQNFPIGEEEEDRGRSPSILLRLCHRCLEDRTVHIKTTLKMHTHATIIGDIRPFAVRTTG